MPAMLEHTNFTVTDPDTTAKWMCDLFGWHIRWSGAGMTTGYTVHVGTDSHYLALFSYGDTQKSREETYRVTGGLNHIALVTDDIKTMETNVRKLGFEPRNHGDYEPGLRFYFEDNDGIEFEIVQYD
ncbi:MAG: VOC family protein [Paracoccaceae bacterium]